VLTSERVRRARGREPRFALLVNETCCAVYKGSARPSFVVYSGD
jgi:hypothetical protein